MLQTKVANFLCQYNGRMMVVHSTATLLRHFKKISIEFLTN